MEEQKKDTLRYLPGDILRNLDPAAKSSKYWFIRIVSVEPEAGILGAALRYKFTAWNEEDKEMYYSDPDSRYNDFMFTRSDVLKATYELYRRSPNVLEYQARVWCNEICMRCHDLEEIYSDKCIFTGVTWSKMRLPVNFMFIPGQEIATVKNRAIVRTTKVKDIFAANYEGLTPGFLANLENGRFPDALDIHSEWPENYDFPVKSNMYNVDLEVPLVMNCKFRDYCVFSDCKNCKNCKCQTLKGMEDVDPKWKPDPSFFGTMEQEGPIKKTTQEDYDVPQVEEESKAPGKKENIIRRIIRWIKR